MQNLIIGIRFETWMVILTAAVVVMAIIQAVIYAGMHRTSRRVERAYVSLSHYPPGLTFGFIGSGSDDPIPKQDVAAKIRVANYGNTPARVTRILIQPVVAIEPLPRSPRYDESLGQPLDAMLGKNDFVDVPVPMRITYSDLTTIRSLRNNVAETVHPLRLFLIGYIDYIDQFDNRHRAGYARMYNHWVESEGIQPDDPTITNRGDLAERHRTRNNLVFMSQRGYNYDRKRAEGEGEDWDESQPNGQP